MAQDRRRALTRFDLTPHMLASCLLDVSPPSSPHTQSTHALAMPYTMPPHPAHTTYACVPACMRNACTSTDTDTDPYIPQPTYLYGNEVIQFMPSRAHNQQVPVRRSRRAAGLPAEDDGGFADAGPACVKDGYGLQL